MSLLDKIMEHEPPVREELFDAFLNATEDEPEIFADEAPAELTDFEEDGWVTVVGVDPLTYQVTALARKEMEGHSC